MPSLKQVGKLLVWGALLFGVVSPGYSQFLSWGVEAGLPLNTAVNEVSSGLGTVTTSTNPWIIGPTVQIGLPFHLAIEVDALYRSEGYRLNSQTIPFDAGSIGNWQFPFLVRYDLSGGPIRPFVDAGLTYRHLFGSTGISDPDSAGFTIGGGIAVKVFFLRLSPEVRYTRWNNTNILNSAYAMQSQNQADFLVGFTF